MRTPPRLVVVLASLSALAVVASCAGTSTPSSAAHPSGSSSPAVAPSTSASIGASSTVCTPPTVQSGTGASVSDLTGSRTTPEAGGLVRTAIPTLQGQPYLDPPVIKSHHGVLRASFDSRTSTFSVAGRHITGLSYAGKFMGPTLWVNPGDTIRITQKNSMANPTNFHTHGLHTSPVGVSDNIFRSFTKGSTNQIVIKVPHGIAPGTYWYHSHVHGFTEGQVFSGLAGALVVTGVPERLPQSLRGVADHLMALRDVQVHDMTILTDNINSDAPTTRTVNGQVNPVLAGQPGCAQLLRLGNWSPDIWYRLKLDGAKFAVLAEDANLVDQVRQVNTLLMPPGKRFDVLVYWPSAGTYHLRTMPYSTGPEGDNYPERVLATFHVAGKTAPAVELPTTMGQMQADTLPTEQNDPIARHRTIVFSENNKLGQFYINGQMFHSTKPEFVAKLGTTEEWTLKNVTGEQHPFHIHVNDFQLMSVNGKPYHAVSLQDTVKIPEHGQVVIRQRFHTFVGKFVFHCHILAHEDAGMMAVVEVTRSGLPASSQQEKRWQQPSVTMKTSPMPGM